MTVLTPSLVFGDQPLSSTVDPRVLALLLFPSLDNAEGWIAQVISTLVEQHGGTIGGTDQALAVHHSHIEVTLVTLWAHSGHTMRIAMVKYQTTYQYVCVYETHQIQ